jgi:hypothetical protein
MRTRPSASCVEWSRWNESRSTPILPLRASSSHPESTTGVRRNATPPRAHRHAHLDAPRVDDAPRGVDVHDRRSEERRTAILLVRADGRPRSTAHGAPRHHACANIEAVRSAHRCSVSCTSSTPPPHSHMCVACICVPLAESRSPLRPLGAPPRASPLAVTSRRSPTGTARSGPSASTAISSWYAAHNALAESESESERESERRASAVARRALIGAASLRRARTRGTTRDASTAQRHAKHLATSARVHHVMTSSCIVCALTACSILLRVPVCVASDLLPLAAVGRVPGRLLSVHYPQRRRSGSGRRDHLHARTTHADSRARARTRQPVSDPRAREADGGDRRHATGTARAHEREHPLACALVARCIPAGVR